MNSIIEIIENQIIEISKKSILVLVEKGELPNIDIPEIDIEIPRDLKYGDFSVNIAMKITKEVKQPPRKTAELLISNMDTTSTYIEKIECAGPGFINFFLNENWLYDALRIIVQMKESYGQIEYGKNKKVMVEFVSANPTGPLHMGNARGGALGDCLASVMEKAGFEVTREFYVNDAGNQIEKFGKSLEARYLQYIKGEDYIEFPEDGYHGDDIKNHVENYENEFGDTLLELDSETRQKKLTEYALPKNIENIKKGLLEYGIEFDEWFSEKSLYDSGEIDETIEFLKSKGYTLEKEGALWLSGDKLGLEKDEVLVRGNGHPTYMAADIAYHRNKFIKRGYDIVIDLWGADHHGHIARMKSAMTALNIDSEKLEVLIFQLVRLYRNKEVVRMSKRTGKSISLQDLLEEVGKDAARFFFNLKSAGSHLDFDMGLAVEQSNDNPVFYVQYAHARICSILRKLEEEGVNVSLNENANFELLESKEEITLIRKLAEYPEEIKIAAKMREPNRLTRYVMDIAGCFHSFYNSCRVKGTEEELMKSRIVLINCTKIVIKNILDLIKINAPEKM